MSSCLSCSYLLLWTSFEAGIGWALGAWRSTTKLKSPGCPRLYHANLLYGHYNRDDLQQQSLALWMAIKIWSFWQWKWPCLWTAYLNQTRQIDITFTTSKLSDEWLMLLDSAFRRCLDHMDFPFFSNDFTKAKIQW